MLQTNVGSFSFSQYPRVLYFCASHFLGCIPHLIHFLMLNSIQIYHIHEAFPDSIPIKANAFLALKSQSTQFLTLHMVIIKDYLAECLHNTWILKISSTIAWCSPCIFINGIDRWMTTYENDHHIIRSVSICLTLSLLLQYKYSKTRELICR